MTVRLARGGVPVVGLDFSKPMLDIARKKSAGLPNVRWVEGDMRSFDLGEEFSLAIIPGQSFQNLLTADDQAACLSCIRRHLGGSGNLVLHLDHVNLNHARWLGKLCDDDGGVFGEVTELKDPESGNLIRTAQSWTYSPSTQTVSYVRWWEEIGADGKVLDRWERGPIPLHSIFRFEVEHLLARTGFRLDALYGDFFRNPLTDTSSEIVVVATRA